MPRWCQLFPLVVQVINIVVVNVSGAKFKCEKDKGKRSSATCRVNNSASEMCQSYGQIGSAQNFRLTRITLSNSGSNYKEKNPLEVKLGFRMMVSFS